MKETQEDDIKLHLFENLQHKFGEGSTAGTSTQTTSLSVSGNGQTGTFSQVTTFSFNQSTISSPKVTPKSDLNTLLTNYMTQVPVITTVSTSSATNTPSYNFLNPNDPVLLNSLRKSQSRTIGPHTSPVAVYSSPASSAPSTPSVASPTVPHAGFDFGSLFASQSPVTPKIEPRTTAGQNSISSVNSSFQATISNLLNDSTNTTLTSILTSPVTSPPQHVFEAASDTSTDTSAPMTL